MKFFLSAAVALALGISSAAAAQDELIIVSPHWDGIQYEFGRAFESWFARTTGRTLRVRWRDLGGTSQIEKALNANYDANPDTAGVDVFFGGGMDPYDNQKAKGHLQPYRLPDALLSALPRHVGGIPLYDPDYTFYGAALSSFGIVQNRPICRTLALPEVRRWSDLADPRLRGWISSADLRKSGSVHMIYEILLQAYGWERGWALIYQISANTRSFLPSSSAPTKEVSSGEVAYAMSIDVNGLAQQAFFGAEQVRFFIPEDAPVITPDGIAILKGAPNPVIAEQFVTFVMGEEGQRLWMTPTGQPGGAIKFGILRMGVLPSLYSAQTAAFIPLNPFQLAHETFRYSSIRGARRWDIVNDLMGQTIVDVHPHLRRAWAAIQTAPPEQRAAWTAHLSAPMISEAEADAFALFWRKDRLRAGRIANQWMRDAVRRYSGIEEGIKKGLRP
jgi:ABC-type Fe3+ transport system substrate-binding protein